MSAGTKRTHDEQDGSNSGSGDDGDYSGSGSGVTGNDDDGADLDDAPLAGLSFYADEAKYGDGAIPWDELQSTCGSAGFFFFFFFFFFL